MAYLLRILVAVTIITLCSAQCVLEQHKKMGFNTQKHVVYPQRKQGCSKDGQWHALGDTWTTPDCTKCACNHDHIMCCSDYSRPILADPENCTKTLNRETCKVEVKRKDDSDTPCEVEFWIA